jgi:hypothetical protein
MVPINLMEALLAATVMGNDLVTYGGSHHLGQVCSNCERARGFCHRCTSQMHCTKECTSAHFHLGYYLTAFSRVFDQKQFREASLATYVQEAENPVWQGKAIPWAMPCFTESHLCETTWQGPRVTMCAQARALAEILHCTN